MAAMILAARGRPPEGGYDAKMRAAILAVGSELLGTERLDTNSLVLTRTLEAHGVDLCRKAVVGDDLEEIARVLDELAGAAALVLVSGGLGPTADDLTREAAAAMLERGLAESPELVADIEAKFASFGMRMPAVNRRQAEVIDGAEVLANRRGTAPGQRIDHPRGTLFLFPGVPHELAAMVDTALVPWLERQAGGAALERRVVKIACVPESTAEEMLAPAYEEFGGEAIGLLPSAGEIEIHLAARGAAAAPGGLDRLAQRVAELMGEAVFATRDEETLEGVVGALLATAGRTVATAESCTGGLIAERLTRVPGSSAWFLGAVVAYADRLKQELLEVDGGLIELHGAVSREVAEAMAAGARRRLGSDYAIAITGIAGPGGGSEEKPVGTVHLALALPDGRATAHRRLRLPGDRDRVRRLTAVWALDMLRRELAGVGHAAR
jgi:nicotinamide-nucleotide amidase